MPAPILRDAELGRDHFLTVHGDTHFLLIALPPDPSELEAGLASLWSTGADIEPVRPSSQPIGFITQVQTVDDPARSLPRRFDPTALQARLRADRHFAVPLRKRKDAGTLSAERITVGRAFNQDIVLRHGSVSKFHGWIEMDDSRGVYVADAGSRNGTRVNEVAIPSRELRSIEPGDLIRFGAITTILTDPETFLNALAIV